MKITYGKTRHNGKTIADVDHKFARAWSVDEQAAKVLRHVFRKHPDASDFEWYTRIESGQICAFRCNLNQEGDEL